jgi:hypothetical protein
MRHLALQLAAFPPDVIAEAVQVTEAFERAERPASGRT